MKHDLSRVISHSHQWTFLWPDGIGQAPGKIQGAEDCREDVFCAGRRRRVFRNMVWDAPISTQDETPIVSIRDSVDHAPKRYRHHSRVWFILSSLRPITEKGREGILCVNWTLKNTNIENRHGLIFA